MVTLSERFQDRLKSLRKERGLTQEELARQLDIPDSTIRRYETEGNIPKRERLELIADFFGVSIDYLVGRTDERNKILSEQARMIIDHLDLSDEDFMKNITLEVDGIPLTEEEVKTFLAWIRVERSRGNQNK